MAKNHIAVISIGSNAADAQQRVQAAIDHLSGRLLMFSATPPYPTEPEPPASPTSGNYYNAVASGLTPLSADDLTAAFKAYERENGRSTSVTDGGDAQEVTIDIDLVVCDGYILRPEQYHAEYFLQGMATLLHH